MQAPQDQSNEARDDTQLSPPYVERMLKLINPNYFKKSEAKGCQSPKQVIAKVKDGERISRVLDMLPLDNLFTPQEIDKFYQNCLSYGYEFALAQILNPILLKIFDFKNQVLNQIFIEQHLGQDTYEQLHTKLTDQKIAQDLRGSLMMLLASFLAERCEIHPLSSMFSRPAVLSESFIQEEEQSNIVKLLDDRQKYYFCQEMLSDISKFAEGKQLNYLTQDDINHRLENYKASARALEQFIEIEENKQKVLAHLHFGLLLQDLNELKKDSKNNAQLIEEIQSLIQKYDYDNYEHQLNRRAKTIALKLAVSIIATLLLVALVVLIAIAVFASGGAAASPIIIPYISNIYGFAVSAFLAFIGFGISIYLDYKYGTNNQAIKEFEDKKASENSMVSGPDSTQAITNALGPKSSHDENSPRASDELEEKDGQLSSSSTPVNENQHDSPSAPSLPGTVNRGIDDDNASPSSGPSSGR